MTPTRFEPTTPLEHAVRDGNADGMLALLRGMSATQRVAERGRVRHLAQLLEQAWFGQVGRDPGPWGMVPTQDQRQALGIALVLCGEAADVARFFHIRDEALVALLTEFSPPCLDGLADAMLPRRIRTVQALIAAGLVPRPDTDDYALGLIALPSQAGGPYPFEQFFVRDPGLKGVLLRMFEIEGDGDTSLATIEKYYTKKGASWSEVILTACQDGSIPREAALDRTLAALERDWPQFRAGWFSRFHELLAPTVAEMQAHAERYLQLLASRIPPTVSLALDVVQALEAADALDRAVLMDALSPVFAGGSKGQVEKALKLADRVVQADPAQSSPAARLAMTSLAQEAPDLQKKVLQRLKAWALDDAGRALLQPYLAGIAASNRALAEELAGAAPPPAAAPAPVSTPVAKAVRLSPLAPSRVVVPVAEADDLVACIAHAFEHDADLDAVERAIEGLVRLAPASPELRKRLAPVVKRAAKVKTPVAGELARLLLAVVGAPVARAARAGESMHARLADRIDLLIEQAAQGWGLAPLSSPTHQRGFIAPQTLVERVATYQQRGLQPAGLEQQLALLRLAPGADGKALAQARELAPDALSAALRHALGDDASLAGDALLFAAAARIRHPGGDDPMLVPKLGALGPDAALAARYAWSVASISWNEEIGMWHHYIAIDVTPERPTDTSLLAVGRHVLVEGGARHSWQRASSLADSNAALLRYSASLLPSELTVLFAEGARVIGDNLDFSEVNKHAPAYVEPLLDPAVEPGPLGALMLWVALGDKEPGLVALAVDALVATVEQGRLPVSLLAETLRELMRSPLLKPGRLRKSLDSALRLAPGLAPVVVELLWAAVEGCAAQPPRDVATLLELLHELMVASDGRPNEARRSVLAAIPLGGKGRALQRALLAI